MQLKGMLTAEERVIADRGYRDSKCDYLPNDLIYQDKLYSTVRARHENANRRIKQFNVRDVPAAIQPNVWDV